jgi:sulfide:quinone oxidoreductase
VQARVVVLGAGFGGLELANRMSAEFGDEIDLTLIDKNDAFVFGFTKLDVMFGRATPESVRMAYRDIAKPGVRFLRETVTAIDPQARRVTTDAGVHEADHLVIALGADYDYDATPGLVEYGNDFYSVAGATRLREVLSTFSRGRVLIGVCGNAYKCPPAPSEAALLLHDHLVARGCRDACEITFVVPTPVPVTSSAEASRALVAAFAERGIAFVPGRLVASLDGERRCAVLDDGSEIPFDLFLGVPKHRAPQPVIAAGLTEGGFVKVNPATLETAVPDVYAIGDVATVGVPKAGHFAEGQARAVAASLTARLRGAERPGPYVGHGGCYIEFGVGRVARVDVDFDPAAATPTSAFHEPSAALVAEKQEFGASRRARWFGG